VAGLGLNEPEDPTPQTPYALMMQKLTRFLFEYLHSELQAVKSPVPAAKESAPADLPRSLANLFGMRTSGADRCLHCGHETSRETSSMLIDLTAVRKVGKRLPAYYGQGEGVTHHEHAIAMVSGAAAAGPGGH